MKQDSSVHSQKTVALALASTFSALVLLALPKLADPFLFSTGDPRTPAHSTPGQERRESDTLFELAFS